MKERTDWMIDPDRDTTGYREAVDWWGLWVRRKGLILFGLVLSLALATIYFFQATPIYESTAQVYVIQRTPPSVPVQGIDGASRYGQTPEKTNTPHEIVIASPLVVGRAVSEGQLMERPSFAPLDYTPDELVDEWLEDELLSVYPVDGESSIVELYFRCPDPDDSAAVLQAVIASYGGFLAETHQNVGLETAELIRKAKDELLTQLTEKETQYSLFRQESPLLWKDGEGTNLHLERQAQIEQARSEILLRRSELQARIGSIETALERDDNHQALLLMIAQSVDKPLQELEQTAANPLHRELLELLVEQRKLEEKYGSGHPKVRTLNKQVELAQHYVARIETQIAGAREAVTEPAQFLKTFLQSLRDEVRTVDQQVAELDGLFAQEQESAKELTVYLVRDSAFRNDLKRTEQLFEAIVKRLEEINIVSQHEAYNLQVLSQPSEGEQVSPNPIIVFPVAILLGLLLGGGLAYVVDLADKTFHTPSEICQHLQLPLVGHIPVITPPKLPVGAQFAPMLCTYHAPKSPMAESYRTVRTALYFSAKRRHKVIQVTSPTPGDGKSTLAANLAVTIANSGKKVLLLDADFRRPTVHKLFGLSMQTGLAGVITGEIEPHDAYQTTEIENLTLMTCGPRPHNPSELLTSPRFEELLALLREEFDFVLIDTPPLLAVTDPSAVAARADGVLLALRLKRNVRPGAMRATELLAELGADVLGVVVNAVSEKQAGYQAYGYRAEYGRYYSDHEPAAPKQLPPADRSLQDTLS